MRYVLVVALLLAGAGRAWANPPTEDELAELDARIGLAPGSVELILRRAELRLRDGEVDGALADLRLVEGIAPDEARVLLVRGQARYAQRQWRAAEADLAGYVERTGGTLHAWYLLGRIQEQLDRHEEALRSYASALSLGTDADVVLRRGRLLEALGRLDEAASTYRAGLGAMAGAVHLRVRLIEVETALGHHDRALGLIDGALAQARLDTRWLLRRGAVLEAAGRPGEAREARTQALAEAERLLRLRRAPAALMARGEALLALGRAREAIADLEQALRRAPRLTEARALLAEARRLAGEASR